MLALFTYWFTVSYCITIGSLWKKVCMPCLWEEHKLHLAPNDGDMFWQNVVYPPSRIQELVESVQRSIESACVASGWTMLALIYHLSVWLITLTKSWKNKHCQISGEKIYSRQTCCLFLVAEIPVSSLGYHFGVLPSLLRDEIQMMLQHGFKYSLPFPYLLVLQLFLCRCFFWCFPPPLSRSPLVLKRFLRSEWVAGVNTKEGKYISVNCIRLGLLKLHDIM